MERRLNCFQKLPVRTADIKKMKLCRLMPASTFMNAKIAKQY